MSGEYWVMGTDGREYGPVGLDIVARWVREGRVVSKEEKSLLIDIGVKPFLVASSTRSMMAQRLVRKVCRRCATPYEPSEAELRALNLDPNNVGNATFTMKGPWQVVLEASRGKDRVVQGFDYNIR